MMRAKEGPYSELGRSSSGFEVVTIDDHLAPCACTAAAARDVPTISNMNIQNSKNVQIGPKIENVYTTVHNNEVIKGRWLGLELVSTRAERRLRCCVAVFVCWALVFACGLVPCVVYFALPKPGKLDIGLNDTWYLRRPDWQALPPSSAYKMDFLATPVNLAMIGHSAIRDCKLKHECISAVREIQKDHLERFGDIGPNFLVGGKEGLVFEGRGANVVGAALAGWNFRLVSIMFLGDYFTCVPNQNVKCGVYLWQLVKNSTRAERLSCTAAILLVAICAALIIYFTTSYNSLTEEPDTAPAEWYITRDMWLAAPYNNTLIAQEFEPLRLVIIQHSVSTECHRFDRCASELRNLQDWFIRFKDRDLPYNFVIGNDGRAYEARGWRTEGAHTYGYNRCSIGIGFIGDYREEKGAGNTRVSEAQQNRTHFLLAKGVKLGYLHPDYLVVGGKDLRNSESPGSNLYKAIQRWKHYDHQNGFYNKTCEEINLMPFGKPLS